MDNRPAGKNQRVLVVDDNLAIHEDFRKILSRDAATEAALDATGKALFGGPAVVRQIQFEVDSADQGQEGVRLVKKALAAGRPYAVAFVDVRMPPGWDGVETTQKMWELDPSLQVVLCTAYSDYSWDEIFEKLGHSDGLLILKKPFDAVEAFQLAHALTEKWRLHQQSRRKMEALERAVAERTRELQQVNRTLQMEVVEHLRAAEELKFKNIILSTQQEASIDGILVMDEDANVLSYNHQFVEMWGIPTELMAQRADPLFLQFVTNQMAEPQSFLQRVQYLYEHRRETSSEEIMLKDGRIIDRHSAPMFGAGDRFYGRVWYFRNITGRKRIEAQLFQSQKMETVGKLAGGVAHEFNSILTTIIGQSELLLGELPPGNPLSNHAAEIRKAAELAAALTRQLLAYGRKQILQPEILDLNAILAGLESALRHLLGRGVDVRLAHAAGLKAVKADAGQIEQVILNLALNAREAMPNGGQLTLETANVSFDQEQGIRHPEMKPGDYVMLAITDSGTGMSAEVKAHLFEPFFSTRGVGQGAGLGLSTCYGIIKQSGGHISVYSEPGLGATFKIYLPPVESPAQIPLPRLDPPDLPRGTETLLLVEDDPVLREMAATLLRRLGYTVLEAANGLEALGLKQPRDLGPIDVLFTDVVMPQMSGKELADRVQALSPRTRILFTAANTGPAIVQQGGLNAGVALLQKPFTPSALARKLREVLDAPGALKPDPARKTLGFTPLAAAAKPPGN